MRLFIRTDRTHAVELPFDATLEDVQGALEDREESRSVALFRLQSLSSGYDWDACYFAFEGRVIPEGVELSQLEVTDESQLVLHGRLLGGGKKRKKKTYTKPKKPKHKRQHEKLRALKMYKIEGQKVIRCKKECPSCGPGIFMGTHFDRISCGKCSLTYLYAATDQ